MTWTACWRLWGEKFAVTYDLVWKEGRLDLRNMNVLKSALHVRDGECPQSLWVCGDPVGPPLGGPHVGDCEGMGYPVRIQCFQGRGEASIGEE